MHIPRVLRFGTACSPQIEPYLNIQRRIHWHTILHCGAEPPFECLDRVLIQTEAKASKEVTHIDLPVSPDDGLHHSTLISGSPRFLGCIRVQHDEIGMDLAYRRTLEISDSMPIIMPTDVDVELKRLRYTIVVPLLFIAGLIVYKGNSAIITVQKIRSTGVMSARPEVVSFGGAAALTAAERTYNYFGVIWPALVFGILISAAVRAFVPAEWFVRPLAGKLGGPLLSGVAGAPLMLCSCCVISVFSTVYERSLRLGPSLAIMLASPALNPAALILTFLLFAPKIAAARLLMAVPVVFLSGILIERVFPNHAAALVLKRDFTPTPAVNGLPDAALRFGRSLIDVSVRTMPVLLIGVICSMLLIEYVPADLLASHPFRSFAVIVVATIAVPIALPTFFEIPLALGILAAGGPIGAAAALLFAGPVINLPSLLALTKLTDWKVAATLAGVIWAAAVAGGLILNQTLP